MPCPGMSVSGNLELGWELGGWGGDERNCILLDFVIVSHVNTWSADRGARCPGSLDLPCDTCEELEGKAVIGRCTVPSGSRI